MLNPQMHSWGMYELARRNFEQRRAEQGGAPQTLQPTFAPGSMEWQAEQEEANRKKESCTAAPAPAPDPSQTTKQDERD